jgi:hypothetical protein
MIDCATLTATLVCMLRGSSLALREAASMVVSSTSSTTMLRS